MRHTISNAEAAAIQHIRAKRAAEALAEREAAELAAWQARMELKYGTQ